MKKFGIYFLLSASLVGMTLNSCDKDEFSEEDAMNLQDKLDKNNTLFNDTLSRVAYTVNVVDASTSALKSGSAVNAISGAVVKLVQDNNILTQTVDASGIVTFDNLKRGYANVNITLADYSEVNYTVDLSISSLNEGGHQFANIIPLIPVAGAQTATISGKVTFESDLTNLTPETVPTGTKVLAMVDAGSAAISKPDNIISISYDKLSLSATTDANGNYTMTVPATVNGLKYDVFVSDFAVDQRLIIGENEKAKLYNAQTNFGSSFTSPSTVAAGKFAQVVIGAPDYTFTEAQATAILDNSKGIDYVHNVNVGGYYEPGTYYYSINNPNNEGSDAFFRLDVDSWGHASGTIASGGSKFDASFDTSKVVMPYIQVAAKAVVTNVDNGKVTEYRVVTDKEGVFCSTENLQFVKHTGAGVGAITDLPGIVGATGAMGDEMEFSTAVHTLTTATGSSFAIGDSLILTVNPAKSNVYKGKIFLSNGSVTEVNIDKEGANYVSGQVDVVVSPSPVDGGTATATATVKDGKIEKVTLTSGGFGYKSVPTITFLNKAEKVQAVAYATLDDNGQISGVTITNAGNGYLTIPTVTIQSISGVGSGAVVNATVSGGKVTGINLINKGNGYFGNTYKYGTGITKSQDLSSNPVKGVSNEIVNIYLGTGERVEKE